MDVPAEKIVFMETPRNVTLSSNTRLVKGNTKLNNEDFFVAIYSEEQTEITLPPLVAGDKPKRVEIHSVLPLTHCVRCSENDNFFDGRVSIRLGVMGKYTFVGEDNVWYNC